MPFPLIVLPIAVPVVLAAVTGIAIHTQLKTPSGNGKPLIHELPQQGLTTCTLRPQFRLNNKVLNVFSRTGSKNFRFVRHQPSPESCGMTYSLLDARTGHPISTIHSEGLKSDILFHATDDMLRNLGVISIRHVVDARDHYRMFILPDGNTYQWTGRDHFLERVVDRGTPDSEIRERIAVARRIGTRIWEIKYDERKIAPEIVFSTVLISILDQWNTVFGVGGIFLKSDKNLTVKFQQ
ncbi:hypothetical protein V1511DRAFT_143522 [Dipodascopsis uninucleata]